uniref:Uncharacterized protein n=1 Tax=Opuntia streptacantha TaxID=393608 RepID=A0A7C8YFV7_OPUST
MKNFRFRKQSQQLLLRLEQHGCIIHSHIIDHGRVSYHAELRSFNQLPQDTQLPPISIFLDSEGKNLTTRKNENSNIKNSGFVFQQLNSSHKDLKGQSYIVSYDIH